MAQAKYNRPTETNTTCKARSRFIPSSIVGRVCSSLTGWSVGAHQAVLDAYGAFRRTEREGHPEKILIPLVFGIGDRLGGHSLTLTGASALCLPIAPLSNSSRQAFV